MNQKAIIVSGYFNPIHKGHIEYFQNAKTNWDILFVIVNSDFQKALKWSKEFQEEKERDFIVENLRLVDKCFLSIDNDRTVVESIKEIHRQYGAQYQLIFANGGGQNNKLHSWKTNLRGTWNWFNWWIRRKNPVFILAIKYI